jgi:microcystin-dependent protein
MAQPYVGEIRMFAGTFAPAGWLFCEGQLLSIAENETLFQLIGTSYGGDGQVTFALPDLRGRLPVHQGNGLTLAQAGGDERIALTVQQMPVHSHALLACGQNATQATAASKTLARPKAINLYSTAAPNVAMTAGAIGQGGAGQPHGNLQPYLCLHFIISLFGIFPSPT